MHLINDYSNGVDSINNNLHDIVIFYLPCDELCFIGVRSLYSITSLGVDGYLQQRERIKTQFDTLGDRFRSKMKDFVAPSSSNMVFTEDLKQMIHLADGTEEDLDLIEQMMVK